MNSLQARLRSQTERAPEARALCFYEADRAPVWKSRGEIWEAARDSADRLADGGLSPGDRCVIVLPSGEASALAVLGVLLRGAVPLLVAPPTLQSGSHSSLLSNLERVLEAVKPTVVLCPPAMAAVVEDLRGRHPEAHVSCDLAESTAEGSRRRTVPGRLPESTDLAALQLTSGTTGAPRVCVWSQERVLAALDGMYDAMRLGADDVCFNWTPLYHDMGLTNNFLLCLTAGVPLAMLSPHDFVKRPALWLQGLQATRATVTWSPNFGFALAARRARPGDLEGLRLDHVRAFWNAAERIHLETMLDFHRRFESHGVAWSALKTNFGCAENVGGATFSDPRGEVVFERVDRRRLYEEGLAEVGAADESEEVAIVSAGRPYPGLAIEILSPSGERLPDGLVGEISLRTPSAMCGYLGEPEESARVLSDGGLLTGDHGYTRNGELFWTGRVRERINTHGKKLDPSDFESTLQEIGDLRPGCFAAFGIDDPATGTQSIVVVSEVAAERRSSLDGVADAVKQAAFQRLGVSVADVVLLTRGSMTKTSSGKRRHRHYRRLYVEAELEPLRAKEA